MNPSKHLRQAMSHIPKNELQVTAMEGCLQVYTGAGKGKTTAALGLLLRAVGNGMRVFLGQFVKGQSCSELTSLSRFADQVTVRRYGTARFIMGKPSAEDMRLARDGLEDVRRALDSGEFDVVILDEANVAVALGLFDSAALLAVLQARAPGVEVVVTGRGACQELLDVADLVTEMREIKHYYRSGMAARKGIEK